MLIITDLALAVFMKTNTRLQWRRRDADITSLMLTAYDLPDQWSLSCFQLFHLHLKYSTRTCMWRIDSITCNMLTELDQNYKLYIMNQ